ncbi:MAG: ATP-binding protein, partial [Methylococcales bacterium]
VVVVDEGGRIVECNAIALTFLSAPLLGELWTNVAMRSLKPVFANPHEHLVADGVRVSISYRQLGQAAGQIIVLSDVTEMRVLQDMLNQQKQLSAMGEMAASIAHQVRTPLATAVLYASQMSNPLIDDERRRRFSEKILERLHHLERQVNDMLIFAKRGHLAMTTFSLTELLNDVRIGGNDYARHTQIQVHIINKANQDQLTGNAHALRGALLNIVNNAVDALGRVGIIQITATLSNNNLHLNISDNGPGMPEPIRQRIFEPFFTTKSQGTGLGLAVVDSVVKSHGGSVSVASTVGAGTVFSLMLPCLKSVYTPLPGGFSSRDERKEMHDEML